jgi:hypothetical protein
MYFIGGRVISLTKIPSFSPCKNGTRVLRSFMIMKVYTCTFNYSGKVERLGAA